MALSDRTPECEWALQELFEQPAAPSQRLQAHLAGCPHCRQAQMFDRQLVAARPAASLPAGLEARVLRLQRRRRVMQRGAWSMAAAALLGTVGLAFWQPFRPAASVAPPPVVRATEPLPREPADLDQMLAVAFAPAPVVDVTPQDQQMRGLVHRTFLGGR